jgi:hypothetical protein
MAVALVAFYRAIILLVITDIDFFGRDRPGSCGVVNIELVEVYGQAKHPVLGIDFFESSNPLVEGLLLTIKLDIAASDEPNKGVL